MLSLCATHWRQDNVKSATFLSPQRVNNTGKHKSLYFLFLRLYTFTNLYGEYKQILKTLTLKLIQS